MQPNCRFPNNEFLFSIGHLGGVAQLGERLVRNQKASGSIPLTSTNTSKACSDAGLFYFRLFCVHVGAV